MKNIANAMAKTNLKSTLSSIHVHQNDYSPDNLKWMFNNLGFSIEVVSVKKAV